MTLAGLNIAAKRAVAHEDEHALFLSGNGPLLYGLREALARDQVRRESTWKSGALRAVRQFAELAEREGIASSYVTRVPRLTLLAPDIVEAILDRRQGPEVTLARLLDPFPMDWAAQRRQFGQEPGTGRSSAHGN